MAERKVREDFSKSKEYPAVSLNDAIDLILKHKDYPLDKPISYSIAASIYNLKNEKTKSLQYKISAARQFGLISTTGNTFSFTESGKKILLPKDIAEVQLIKIQCFSSPVIYKGLIQSYAGKALPQQVTLENILVRDYGILPAVKEAAAICFLQSAEDAGVIHAGVLDVNFDNKNTAEDENPPDTTEINKRNQGQAIPSQGLPVDNEGFEILSIPFGKKRNAFLYMPADTTEEEADYVRDMIGVMFKKLYKIDLKL